MSISLSEIEMVSPNPAHFADPYQWRIRMDVLEELDSDVEFKVVWIGSSTSNAFDETLEECEVGPLAPGANEFILEHNAPNWKLIPPEDLLSVTVILITVSYKEQEFLRIGYYVNVAYDKDTLNELPPDEIHIDRLARNVLTSKPTLVQKQIEWGGDVDMSIDRTYDSLGRLLKEKPEHAAYQKIMEEQRKRDEAEAAANAGTMH
eukprot:TRINITY_DN5775_c0_g1_i2.p5 TRINITY_DN5775_c0_g1~~TRINITY_DN5775_c0_g1_i2.p5  ORF type:complete len:205 (+),score=99.90 TRINITY_DN5775_c0_g1_i2:55-669(+)